MLTWGGAKVRALLSAPASPPTGQWFEDYERAFSLQDFTYLVGQRMIDVNRRTGATEVLVVEDTRLCHDILVARRQRLSYRLSGPWQGSYHVRDIA